MAGVIADEAGIDMGGFIFQQDLGDATEKREIAVHADGDELRGERRGLAEQGGDRVLRMHEADEPGLLERIDGNDLRAFFHGILKRAEHPRVVGAGVLADAEDGVRFEEIIEGDGALADADGLLHRKAAGLVTHVRAVRQVVGTVAAGEKLIDKSGFVAGAAGGVKHGLVRRGQGFQLRGDDFKRAAPRNRLVVGGSRAKQHRRGDAALAVVPEVALRGEVGDGMTGEESRVRKLAGGFRGERLGSVLTELGRRAPAVRVRPGAARAVEAAGLVHLQQPAGATERPGFAKNVPERRRDGGETGRP